VPALSHRRSTCQAAKGFSIAVLMLPFTFVPAYCLPVYASQRTLPNLQQIPNHSAPGVDGQGVTEAKESFGVWIEPMLQSLHR
jgi:hypothetical protein